MAAVAAGDQSAVAQLWAIARPNLTWIVRDALRSTGRPFGPEVVEDAVSAAFSGLVNRAGSWSPQGGAKPWNWARKMVRGCAFEALGRPCLSLDDPSAPDRPATGPAGEGSTPTPPPVEDPLALFEQLAETEPAVGAVLEQFRRAVPKDRDLRVFLRMLLEQAEGNLSPAVTVAALEDLTPANVRQIFHRVGAKLDPVLPGRCRDAVVRPVAGPLRPTRTPRRTA
jgi:hypothetical protein